MARTWLAHALRTSSRLSLTGVVAASAVAAAATISMVPGGEPGAGFVLQAEPPSTQAESEVLDPSTDRYREGVTGPRGFPDPDRVPTTGAGPGAVEPTSTTTVADEPATTTSGAEHVLVPSMENPATSEPGSQPPSGPTTTVTTTAPPPTRPGSTSPPPTTSATEAPTTQPPTTTAPTTAPATTQPPVTPPPTTGAPGGPSSGLTPSGPIVIRDRTNVVIENLHVTNPDGNCVTLFDSSNVTIRNSVIGPCGGDAVYGIRVTNGLVENLEIEDVARGVIFVRSETVKVQDNQLTNAGSYFVQFNNVNGGGNRILRNTGQNQLGTSPALDMISLFASNGLASDPILVAENRIRDGGPSTIGSGIMTGDNGGSYQVVRDNVLVNPGQAGIGVSGGHDITVAGNRVYSATHSWGNVGIAAFNHREFACYNIEVRDNDVTWTNKNDYPNPWWTDGHCGAIGGLSTNNFNAGLTAAIW